MLNSFLQMTWRNPIFMMVAIGAIWFVPGIIIRKVAEDKYREAQKIEQKKKIASLYPRNEDKNLN